MAKQRRTVFHREPEAAPAEPGTGPAEPPPAPARRSVLEERTRPVPERQALLAPAPVETMSAEDAAYLRRTNRGLQTSVVILAVALLLALLGSCMPAGFAMPGEAADPAVTVTVTDGAPSPAPEPHRPRSTGTLVRPAEPLPTVLTG